MLTRMRALKCPAPKEKIGELSCVMQMLTADWIEDVGRRLDYHDRS